MGSLSALLSQRAHTDGARVALSFKERGAWRRLDWSRVELGTSSLRRALGDAGFGAGSVLVVSKRASARSLLAVLAALSLGGTVSEAAEWGRTTGSTAPRWVFARNSAEFARLLDAGAAGALSGILLDDQHGATPLRSTVPVLSYSALVSDEQSASVPTFATERCVLELRLSSDPEATQLLTSWLGQGFELGIPEEAESVERDAGELGVSLRIAPSRSWEAWAHALRGRFAVEGSRKRRFVEWALAVNAEPLARTRWARWISAWFVVIPLRRALQLRQWRRAVSLDTTPSPETALLLGGLGVQLELWESKDVVAFNASDETTAIDTAASERVGELARQSA